MAIRLIESTPNLPSWITKNPMFKRFLGSFKYADWRNPLGKKDIYGLQFDDVPFTNSRDPRFKATAESIPIFLIPLTNGKEVLVGYGQLWSDNAGHYYGDKVTLPDGSTKEVAKLNRQDMIDVALKSGCLLTSNKPKRDKYYDPRNSYGNSTHGRYAGQQYHEPWTRYNGDVEPGYWSSYSGRDKSGYEIPTPSDRMKKLYSIDMDNYAEILDKDYKRLTKLKDQILAIADKADPQDVGYSDKKVRQKRGHLYRYLGDVIDAYNDLLDSVDSDVKLYSRNPEAYKQRKFDGIFGMSSAQSKFNAEILNLRDALKKFDNGEFRW